MSSVTTPPQQDVSINSEPSRTEPKNEPVQVPEVTDELPPDIVLPRGNSEPVPKYHGTSRIFPLSHLKHSKKKLRYRLEVNYKTINHVLYDRGWSQVHGESDAWDFFWCDLSHLGAVLEKRLQGSQMVPHFRNHYEISRKNHLARNMARYKKTLQREGRPEEAKFCDCIPLTFELPGEYAILMSYCRVNPGKNFIVKPAIGCKGKGIFLFRKIRELNEWRATRDWSRNTTVIETNDKTDQPKMEEKETPPEMWLVQTYVDDPYLIAGRKFDIRVYVLVLSYLPLKVWVARDGFARICGAPYDLNNLKDTLAHLTNTSIQLARDNKNPGCKWSMKRLREFLCAKHGTPAFELLMEQIGQIIITSLKSVQKAMMHNKHCFELYGYDILLSESLRPWLIEVNASPSLEATDADDYKLKYNLLSDVFNVLDLEGILVGTELRVGGFDLLWDDGPVHKPCPSPDECGPVCKKPLLNIHLGGLNDRVRHLQDLQDWKHLMIDNAVKIKPEDEKSTKKETSNHLIGF
ncbi:probable tubulin polyglutamylase TTLL9 [Cimex lectularius]|uniref:Tubulin--tyrosine ligase-like protein 9 n=1 Tax=Cimex lectularius TaxID=79782 RepID=A0A8I6RQJ6_CIMLE|nr:probable tubulin polyglutamylase TTLL9 [Cimex lectularius]